MLLPEGRQAMTRVIIGGEFTVLRYVAAYPAEVKRVDVVSSHSDSDPAQKKP